MWQNYHHRRHRPHLKEKERFRDIKEKERFRDINLLSQDGLVGWGKVQHRSAFLA
jgi:hypothetical protein